MYQIKDYYMPKPRKKCTKDTPNHTTVLDYMYFEIESNLKTKTHRVEGGNISGFIDYNLYCGVPKTNNTSKCFFFGNINNL